MPSEFKFRALTSEDWKKVIGDNLIFVEGQKLKVEDKLIFFEGLKLKDTEELKDTEKEGTYTSEPLDSGIPGCSWHRIVLDAYIPENSMIKVSFATSETEETGSSFGYEREFTKAKDDLIRAPSAKYIQQDALIQAPPGKYIRLKINFYREGKDSPILRQVKVYYERLSYLRYLPAIYQEDSDSKDFLERFLSIFESSMYDSEEKISSIPMFFDPMAAPEDFYRWLADWVSLDLYDQLDEPAMRKYILNAVNFYKKKGTVSGLADLVTFLTGKKCCIKEYKNNVFRSWGMEHYEEYELENDDTVNILECEGKLDPNKLDKPDCMRFYRRVSRTVDTSPDKAHLLVNRGKYCDEIHYVVDTSDEGTYSPNVIGIFIFLHNEGFDMTEYGKQLHKIIDSFLPVFVRAIVHIVYVPYTDQYKTSNVTAKYDDFVHTYMDEKFNPIFGCYMNLTNWKWICANDKEAITNNVCCRTYHSGIGFKDPLWFDL